MMEKTDYFERAQSWAVNAQVSAARSRRTAWTVAGVAAGIAMLEAVALAMLLPLKTVQPITLLVDRQTGFVQALDPLQPRRVGADEALTQSFLAQYVSAREGFDRATVSADYRRVALWSTGRARATYLADMPATSPASPFQRYPAGTVVSVRVKSVSKLNEDTALVRFDTLRQGPNGHLDVGQPWISVIRYRYVDAPMQLQDRLVNPLGFQVISYRRDAEAARTAAMAGDAAPWDAASAQAPSESSQPASAVGMLQIEQPGSSTGTVVERRTVPLESLPMGSPLAANPPSTASGVGGP